VQFVERKKKPALRMTQFEQKLQQSGSNIPPEQLQRFTKPNSFCKLSFFISGHFQVNGGRFKPRMTEPLLDSR